MSSGYKTNPGNSGPIRDRTYPSQIAAQRPILAPRIHCFVDYDEHRDTEEDTIRGDRGTMVEETGNREITESRVEQFNRALRHGHSDRD